MTDIAKEKYIFARVNALSLLEVMVIKQNRRQKNTMKRSQINHAVKKAMERLEEYRITLPFFGYWKAEEWKHKTCITKRIRERGLGWDVTDFGSGDFEHCGAVLFTVRNGDKNDAQRRMPYAEKYIILSDRTEQEIPLHYHISKSEDIINRGGGVLVVQLYNRAADGGLDADNKVTVYTDCVRQELEPGESIEIQPGDSITLEPYIYHRFFAKKDCGLLIVGEVSMTNDDNTDNVFYKSSERFARVEEDEDMIYPLVNEYDF